MKFKFLRAKNDDIENVRVIKSLSARCQNQGLTFNTLKQVIDTANNFIVFQDLTFNILFAFVAELKLQSINCG